MPLNPPLGVTTFFPLLYSPQSLAPEEEAEVPTPGESGCHACNQLAKGSITKFMTSEKFLENNPERFEGNSVTTLSSIKNKAL